MISTGGLWLALGAISAGVGTVALVVHLRSHRGKPGADWFLAALSAQAVFCLAHGVSLFVHWLPLRVALEVTAWLGFCWVGPLFVLFALEYTGRKTPGKDRFAAALAVAMALVTVAVVTAPLQDLVWRDVALEPTAGLATLSYGFGPLGHAVILFGTTLATVGGLLLVDTVVSYGPLYRREAAAVTLSILPPSVGLVAWLTGLLPTLGPTAVALGFIPHVLLDAYAFVGSNMFETNPTTRRAAEQTAIDDIATPVLVLDPADRVVDFNAAARPLLAAGADDERDRSTAADGLATDSADVDPLGTPVDRLVDVGPELLVDGGVAESVERSVTAEVGGRHREYVVSRSSLTDPAGTRVGTTLVFQDVTRERRHEQRLDVLNRVLRHNLRNTMTVVVGHARMLQQDAQADAVTDAAETIDRSASELIDVGEKAREFETLRERGPQYRSVSVGETVERAVAEGRPDESDQGDADATGRVDVTVDDATVRTDPKLCSLVVENLVENAVEHSSTSPPSSSTRENALEHVDDPTVVVTATVGDDELCLTVEDDGPGIPPGELAPLESGGETSLEHGGGIGLWIVEWCVTSLGGSWSVETDDGTTVTVRLPDGRTETV